MFSEFPSLPTASHTVYFLLTLDNVSSIHLMQKEHSRSCRRIYASKQRRFFSAGQQQVLKSLSHLLQLCSHFYVPMFIQSKLLVISGAFSPANRKMQTFLCHFSLDSRLNIKTFDWVYALSTSSFTCIIGSSVKKVSNERPWIHYDFLNTGSHFVYEMFLISQDVLFLDGSLLYFLLTNFFPLIWSSG